MNGHSQTQSRVWRWLIPTMFVLLVAIGGGTWWKLHQVAPVRYLTSSVTRGVVARSVTATGTVNPVLTIIVGSYVSGVIQQLYCDYNSVVRAGQICAKIDPRPYQATLDQDIGQLMNAQAALAKDRMDLVRYQKLAEQNSIARQQAEDQLYQVDQDEATVKLDQALIEAAKLNLDYTDIISPVDGTVVSRNVSEGQTIASSFQTPTLFLIATDLTKMQVDTNVSESDVGGMKEGDQATFTVDAYPKRIFQGKITQVRVSPQTVQNVVTFDAVIGISNSDLALMPGMTASTRIIVAERRNVIRVPNQALRFTPTSLSVTKQPSPDSGATGNANVHVHVWLMRNSRPTPIAVTPGLDDDTFTEIVKGDIHMGDQVIVAEDHNVGNTNSSSPRL
jgi:HlyD family secretion protein